MELGQSSDEGLVANSTLQESFIETDVNNHHDLPAVKKTKVYYYKFCPHCCKEVSKKIYKEHRRLFYDNSEKIWTKEKAMCHNDDESCTSDFSSLDEFDMKGDYLEMVSEVDRASIFSDSEQENEEDHSIPTSHHNAEGKV